LCEVAFAKVRLRGKFRARAEECVFLMFIVPPEDRLGVITALDAAGAVPVVAKLTDRGCETWQVRR
jgi:hypothetical protein